MYLDDQMQKIMLKNMGFDEINQDLFVMQTKQKLFDLIIMKIFNFYALKNGSEATKALEVLMHNVDRYGKTEDQNQVIEILRSTMAEYPELLDEVNAMIADLNAKTILDFLDKADEDAQIELFTYMLSQRKVVEAAAEILSTKEV